MKPPITVSDITPHTDNPFPEPFRTTLGSAEWRPLGDAFALSQFGVNHETLLPNAQSALRHWHSKSDELVYVLQGKLWLITDEGEQELSAGMCAGFKAGEPNGHHLHNRSAETAQFLVVGSRIEGDKVVYPDDDIQWLEDKTTGHCVAARKDGSAYSDDMD